MSNLRRVSLALVWTDNNRAMIVPVPAAVEPERRCILGPDECAGAGLLLADMAGRLKVSVVVGQVKAGR